MSCVVVCVWCVVFVPVVGRGAGYGSSNKQHNAQTAPQSLCKLETLGPCRAGRNEKALQRYGWADLN